MSASGHRRIRFADEAITFALVLVGLGLFAHPEAEALERTTVGLREDWMSSVPLDASSAPVRPPDGANVMQSPPDFSWPDLGARFEYRVTLVYPDGSERSLSTPHNWVNWDEVLPMGRFSWYVQAITPGAAERSRTRSFAVASCAEPFLVPGTDELLRRAMHAARPRALPDPVTFAAMLEQRREGLDRLLKQVDDQASIPPTRDPGKHVTADVESAALLEVDRTASALFAFIASDDTPYYREALRRVLNLAAWDPRGATSYRSADQAARGIAAVLTLAYDWLYPRLDDSQKRQLLDVLNTRVSDFYDDLVGDRMRIAVHPYDSHGNHSLAYLAAISTILAGDLPEAENWLRGALPLALNWTNPWGGSDGGFANGTAYAQWVIGDTLLAWNILRWTVDVDVGRKAWLRNHPVFLAYFLPPGAPAGAFGDAAERSSQEQRARFGQAAALFAPGRLARWYAAELHGADPSRLHSLLAPLPGPEHATLPKGTPNAAHFPSIGWVAMHNDLADAGRTSVYFKSSPYGSYNHSHADQNSFVITAGGQALAIDSGYYDGYDTKHWRNWYKQTRAHNAITFDGGQGQVVFEESGEIGPGNITDFEHHEDYDLVSGDATAAYGGALERAVRSLVYLRPDRIVVHDHLVSAVARRWEWNIHAAEKMRPHDDRRIEIRAGDERLCVEMLESPAVEFVQRNSFDAAPRIDNLPAQWHGAFVTRKESTSANFVAVLGVGCPEPDADLRRDGDRWELRIGGRHTTLEQGVAQVRPRDGKADGAELASHPGLTCEKG